MRRLRLWGRLLGVQDGVVLAVRDEERKLVVSVRLRRGRRLQCGRCGAPCPGYDQGVGRRRWRAMDTGILRVFLEAAAPRVRCALHGVVTARVPWARHDSGFTRSFEEQVCWLVTQCSKRAVSQLMRIDWKTTGRIVKRVVDEAGPLESRVGELRRIGIDEVSFRRGQRYLTVVVDHDSGNLLWAAEGHDRKTLVAFFDLIGPEKYGRIELVSADGVAWIRKAVRERCPHARICMDPFHVVAWATDALDEVRRDVWNDARRAGQKAVAKELKGARYALWKNPEDLTQRQRAKLSDIERTNAPLYRAYLLKEQLRQVFALKGERGLALLKTWLAWASRCRIPAFVRLGRSIRRHLKEIRTVLADGISNARVEGINTRIRLAIRIAYGFRSAEALIATVMLICGGLCPALPGRT